MTATVISADGTHESDVVIAATTLAPGSTDVVTSYRIGNRVFFVKIPRS
jgi:hypothetical protein